MRRLLKAGAITTGCQDAYDSHEIRIRGFNMINTWRSFVNTNYLLATHRITQDKEESEEGNEGSNVLLRL
jgi:hypothetical protein